MKGMCFHTSETGEIYSGMCAHYHIHADLDLGVGTDALQRKPRGCNFCLNILRTKWVTMEKTFQKKQPRFSHNLKYEYIDMFAIHNDWTI